jgi:16S rRNA (adenine1518-N6/adenine1519-N6)-dimethyltransferase
MFNNPKPNKDLGQHYLIDEKVIAAVVADHGEKFSAIVEVGPGPAVLTTHLCKKNVPFEVIEMDKRFEANLAPILASNKIHWGDAMQMNLPAIINHPNTWLVSNLPYNISAPLTIKFLTIINIKYMTLMYQKEVAQKIFSFGQKDDNSMSSLMALAQNYFKVKLLCKVGRGSFQPPPEVESAVLSYERIDNPIVPVEEFKSYEKFLRGLFAQKRKQISNVLKINFKAEDIAEIFTMLNIPLTIRAEALDLSTMQKLYFAFKKHMS